MPAVVTHSAKIGDVFECSWGYDQTNIDYYEVVGVTPASVKVRKIRSTSAGRSHVRPVPGAFIGEKISTHRVRDVDATGYQFCSIRITSYADAYKMADVTASRYETPAGCGH